jgi:hypothetical protein
MHADGNVRMDDRGDRLQNGVFRELRLDCRTIAEQEELRAGMSSQ